MMDESIYGLADIDIAGAIAGIGFVKQKLKKLASLDLLGQGLARIRERGMRPVLERYRLVWNHEGFPFVANRDSRWPLVRRPA